MLKKNNVVIKTPFIKVDQFLKWQNITSSGGESKILIEAGKVSVNEEVELRRGRKLIPGDRIFVDEQHFVILTAPKGGPED